MTDSAREIQQCYLEVFGDRDWDIYKFDNRKLIEAKICYAIFGPPSRDGSDSKTLGYDEVQRDQVLPIYDKICDFCKFSGDKRTMYMSVIYVCCVPIDDKYGEDKHLYYYDLKSDKICTRPVFKIKKCIKENTSDGITGCCVYVDDIGRIYRSWKEYLEDNKMPKGMIVAPEKGRYRGTFTKGQPKVCLQLELSPACSIMSTVRSVGEVAGTVVAVGTLGVLGVSLFAPIAAGVAITTGVASAVTGIFGVTVSTASLIDRATHDQSIALSDPEARGCWINIGAGATGIAAAGSTKILSLAASEGAAIGTTMRSVHNMAVILTGVAGGAGVINGFASIIIRLSKTGEGPSNLELFQLVSSVLFLSHSLISTKLASTVIKETQTSSINDYRSTLRSNRHRKIYDKMVAETRRVNGITKGNAEVVRNLKTINNRNDFFQGALRVNKQLNKESVKISFKNGKALLNNNQLVSPSEFSKMDVTQRSIYLQKIGPSNVTAKNVPTNLGRDFVIPTVGSNISFFSLVTVSDMKIYFPNLAGYDEDLQEFIGYQLSLFSEPLRQSFSKILNELFESLSYYTLERLRALHVHDTDLLFKLFQFLLEKFRSMAGDDADIPNVINKFILNDDVVQVMILELQREFTRIVEKEYEPIKPREVRCKTCEGLCFE